MRKGRKRRLNKLIDDLFHLQVFTAKVIKREVELIRKFKALKIQNPIDVVCHENGKPHIVKIDKFYVINDVAYAYCKEHDLFFHVDSKKQPLEEEPNA